MVKKIISIIVILLLISIVSAITVKQNDCINIKNTCGNCTYMNITSIIYPNGSQAINQVVMTKVDTEYNYTYCFNVVGNYLVNGKGDPLGTTDIWQQEYTITTTGQVVGLPNIILVVVFLVSSVVTLLIGNSFDKSKWLVRTSFYFISLLLLVLALSSASIIASESLNLSLLSNSGMLVIISIVSFFALYLFIMWSIETLKSVKQKEGVRWQY